MGPILSGPDIVDPNRACGSKLHNFGCQALRKKAHENLIRMVFQDLSLYCKTDLLSDIPGSRSRYVLSELMPPVPKLSSLNLKR